ELKAQVDRVDGVVGAAIVLAEDRLGRDARLGLGHGLRCTERGGDRQARTGPGVRAPAAAQPRPQRSGGGGGRGPRAAGAAGRPRVAQMNLIVTWTWVVPATLRFVI